MQINEATFVSLFKHARNLCMRKKKTLLQVAIALSNLCICTRPGLPRAATSLKILLNDNAHKGPTTCVLPPGRLRFEIRCNIKDIICGAIYFP
jgi:hypothetical protein